MCAFKTLCQPNLVGAVSVITNLRVDLRLQLYCLPAGGGDSDGNDCSSHIVTLSAFLHPRPAPSSQPPAQPW